MDQEEQKKYRDVIESQIVELRQSLDNPDGSTATVKLDNAIGRLTRVDALQSQQMALELQRRRQGKLARLERALVLIDEGKYGICGKCKEDIPTARLEIFPDARTCVECASLIERPRPWG